jgi:hypothetical protein
VFDLESALPADEPSRAFKCPPFRDVLILSPIAAAVQDPRM